MYKFANIFMYSFGHFTHEYPPCNYKLRGIQLYACHFFNGDTMYIDDGFSLGLKTLKMPSDYYDKQKIRMKFYSL